MLQQEFEELTGLKVSSEAYSKIEECYMNTDIDKDVFCKLWIKSRQGLKEIEVKTVAVRQLCKERDDIVDFLIEQAEKWSASDLREKAISMIGEKEYIRKKIEKGYNLWEADRKLLVDFLRK